MDPNTDPEVASLNDAKIRYVDLLGDSDAVLGFSNGATVRIPLQLLKNIALVHAKEIVYPDKMTS